MEISKPNLKRLGYKGQVFGKPTFNDIPSLDEATVTHTLDHDFYFELSRDHKRTLIEKTDSIIKLPENIIHHMLSFLPLKCAVMTSIQSRHWINMWKLLLIYNTIIDMMRVEILTSQFSKIPSLNEVTKMLILDLVIFFDLSKDVDRLSSNFSN
ncbi:putative F-box/LRR-repeat protein At3g18150 [Aristolochia californica]|uniref:putative F-box/LRR-repeat protein At3g18150 n=1 Tax=Aristolochia californica TaxID=171875 RepID=UPI0035DBCEE8